MTFDSVDAVLAMESMAFVPIMSFVSDMPTEVGPTLESALRQVTQTGASASTGSLDAETVLDRGEMLPHDLWVGRTDHSRYAGDASWRALAALMDDGSVAVPNHETALRADSSGNEEEEEIIVIGKRSKPPSTSGGAGGGGGTGEYPGMPDGPSVGEPPGAPTIANPTPCVSASPSGVSLPELNNMALAASNEIASKSQDKEYGVIFYTLNGQLGRTAVFNNPSNAWADSEINWNIGLALVPAGATVVATLHSHPDVPGINDRIPSYTDMINNVEGRDWESYRSFQNLNTMNYRGIKADEKMLMYIYTDEDGSNTYVYDKNDSNTRFASCGLKG